MGNTHSSCVCISPDNQWTWESEQNILSIKVFKVDLIDFVILFSYSPDNDKISEIALLITYVFVEKAILLNIIYGISVSIAILQQKSIHKSLVLFLHVYSIWPV